MGKTQMDGKIPRHRINPVGQIYVPHVYKWDEAKTGGIYRKMPLENIGTLCIYIYNRTFWHRGYYHICKCFNCNYILSILGEVLATSRLIFHKPIFSYLFLAIFIKINVFIYLGPLLCNYLWLTFSQHLSIVWQMFKSVKHINNVQSSHFPHTLFILRLHRRMILIMKKQFKWLKLNLKLLMSGRVLVYVGNTNLP